MSRACSLALGLAALLASFAVVHGNERKTPRTDLYGDPLPSGAIARFGTIRLRNVSALAFCKDGKQLISCDLDGEVRFWDAATGKLLRRQRLEWKPREEKSLNALALSPNGTIVVAWCENAINLYDALTGKQRGRIPSINTTPPTLLNTFSPDGKFLALQTSTKDQKFRTQIWDVNAIKKHQTLTIPSGVKLARVAFSWDGKRLVGSAEKFVHLFLWDTGTGKLLRERKTLGRFVADSLAFSPDGKTLALGSRDDGVLRLLATDTLKEKTRMKVPATNPNNFIHEPVFSPKGDYLAASWGTYRYIGDGFRFDRLRGGFLWELSEAKEPRCLPFHGEIPRMFAPDGKTLFCLGAGKMSLYDVAANRFLYYPPGHHGIGLALAVSPDGKILASGDTDGILRLWDAATTKELRSWQSRDLFIDSCFLSLDAKRVAAGNLGGPTFDIQAWETDTGKKLGRFTIRAEYGCLYAAAMSANGRYFAGVYAPEVNEPPAELILWDVASGRRLSQRPYKLQREEDSNGISYRVPAAFSPDGERVTVWLGDRLGIEDVLSGSLLAKLPKKGMGWPPVFSPDGRLLMAMIRPRKEGSSEKEGIEVRSLIEAASGQEIVRLELTAPNQVAFTPDSRALLVSGFKNLRVRDTSTGEQLYQMAWPEGIEKAKDRGGSDYLSTLAALPGGRVATSMADGDILVWDLQRSRWPKPKGKRDLDRKELASLWSDLAKDARTAYRAIGKLSAAPAPTVAFLDEHFRPRPDGKRIAKLVADLDSDSYSTRETASRELKRIPYRAEPMLRWTLQHKPSLELRRRIEPILTEPRFPSSEDLRALRALAVLERIGTPEARRILEKLAGGAALPETQAAQAALQRLKRREAWTKETLSP